MNTNGAVVLTSPTGATLTLAGPGTDVLCAGPDVEVRDGVCKPKRNFTTTAEALQVVNTEALQVVNTTLYSAIDTIANLTAHLESAMALQAELAAALTNISLTPGPKGEKGDPGANGADGLKGDPGTPISDAYITTYLANNKPQCKVYNADWYRYDYRCELGH